ncbi:hypothetical protein [Nocardia sp. NPDC005745]|uniref:hypothetical protein n=1 Tax=Nocardia sp. NPDC005745 TaxID=3157061 RepID=UPI0033F71FFA
MTATSAEMEAYAPASPFAETFQLMSDGESSGFGSETLPPVTEMESPFRSEYEQAGGPSGPSPEREAYETMVSSLYEMEFGEALYELAAEAAATLGEQSEEVRIRDGEQFLEHYMTPLVSEAEAMLDRYAEQYMQHDITTSSEDELDRLFESIQPSFEHLSPAFENFLGKLWKKAKSVARGAVRLAKKGIAAVGKIIPLGWIFGKLKKLVRPLLKRVLKLALGRLPVALRPAARKLAGRLFREQEQWVDEAESFSGFEEAETEAAAEAHAHPDPDTIQREFDATVASLFFTEEESEQESIQTEAAEQAEQEAEDRLAELDSAREQFIRDVTQAPPGGDLTEAMENFVPAILGALKLGINIIGRGKVVGFLAKYVARLVRPYVGADVAKPLSKAIVSTGMSLVGLEVPAEQSRLAGEAVASAVEGTIRRVAEQGQEVFEDQRLLEAAVQEAFTEAAAESFPPDLIREEYQEVTARAASRGTWVLRPATGRRRYKRYTRVLDVTVSRPTARLVTGFGAVPLAAILQARLGVTAPVTCKAYLYEAIVGTKLSTIARLERDVPGLGPTTSLGWKLFLPLTRQTAATLFGEPLLGRDVANHFLLSPHRIAVGQRFVILVPQSSSRRVAPQDSATTRRPFGHTSQVNLTLNIPASQAQIYIYLNETDTQAVAASMRRGESVTPAIVLLKKTYVAALRSMLSGDSRRHVKVVHETAAGEEFAGKALSAVGVQLLAKIGAKIIDWIGMALSEYFTRQRQDFLTAADKPINGVTIIVTARHNSMMQVLDKALRGDAVGSAIALTKALLQRAEFGVRTVAGFRS